MSFSSKKKRFRLDELYIRQEGLCGYCGRSCYRSEFTTDHIEPRSKGGMDRMPNLVGSCFKCNQEKADKKGIKPLSKKWRKLRSVGG